MSSLRKSFEHSIEQNKSMMITMFDHVYAYYNKMFALLESNDYDDAKALVAEDFEINEQERSINEHSFIVILKQAPVASDLRKLMTSVKIANDLERIADYASNVGIYIMKTKHENDTYRKLLLGYKDALLGMLLRIKDAYVSEDVKIAVDVCELDSQIDVLYKNHIKAFILTAKRETNFEAEEASRALLVIKQLERAGDHITNIAEHIIFLHTGKHVSLN